MQPLRTILQQAETNGVAVGHFNVSDLITFKGVFEAARDLDIERIRAIKASSRIFMTLHGGSGTDDNDLREAIAAGITIVHISTEVRLAWRRGMDSALAKQPNEIVPYKILPEADNSVKQVVASRLALFSGRVAARSGLD